MRVDIIFVITFAFCGLSLAASVPDLQVKRASTAVHVYDLFYYIPLDGVGDLAFTAETEARILKRDSNGTYNEFTSVPLRNMSVATTTNGEWFGSIFFNGIELFRVDQNGQSYNYSIIDTPDPAFVAKILEDNTLMMAFSSYIVTYEYDNSQWIVINNSSFTDANFVVTSTTSAAVQSNALVVFNNVPNADNMYNIYIITRQSDKSWKIIETIAVNSTFQVQMYSFYWDGSNTLLAALLTSDPDIKPNGALAVFNKINGEWTMSQFFSAAKVGVTQFGFFGGGPLIALDSSNVLVAAPADGINGPADFLPGAGSVFLMQRDDKNEWPFIARFKSDSTMLGGGIAKNNQDILMLGCTYNGTFFCSIHSLPACLISPIDVTCPQQRDSCDVDLDNLVAVNNPQCGQITSSYHRITTDKNSITMDVTLSRLFVPNVNCSLTLTCPELSPTESVTTPTTKNMSCGHILVNSITFIVAFVAFVLM